MKEKHQQKPSKTWAYILGSLAMILVLLLGGTLYDFLGKQESMSSENEPKMAPVPEGLLQDVKDGIHEPTGFVADQGLELVIANCTGCHSAKLVTQNRATREGWLGMIHWMQATQNLWDLGPNEEAIVTYLAKHYAPSYEGRRRNLEDIEWYELSDQK